MKTYRVTVFDSEGSNPRLRWWVPDSHAPVERSLVVDEVKSWVAEVENSYRVGGLGLDVLGKRLFNWLDGPTDRWVSRAREQEQGFALQIDGSEGLRALPWELLYANGFLSVARHHPVEPIRTSSDRKPQARNPPNRPLRVLFMACSPLEVAPVLDFEAEEAAILQASTGRVDLVVEESGSLAGLNDLLGRFGQGYFDVLHLSGHAVIAETGPCFVMESPEGARRDASAQDIARAIGPNWPGLLFVSGCSTAVAIDGGAASSMAEALVEAGAPCVLGWSLPVGDVAASTLAATLYRELGDGANVARAVGAARADLFDAASPYWHLLRVFSDLSPIGQLVTTRGTKDRPLLHARPAGRSFSDRQGPLKVADGSSFIGRRRELQRLLRELRPDNPADGPQIAVLRGMGGLGKSALAARVLERMETTHQHHRVWEGKLDPHGVTSLGLRLTDPDLDQRVTELMNRPAPLSDRLGWVLSGPLSNTPCVFVFDGFECGNLDEVEEGQRVCTADALEVIGAFSRAIKNFASASRLIITSRYGFPLPADIGVTTVDVGPLAGVDLAKRLQLTQHLGPPSPPSKLADQNVKSAIKAAAGVPELIARIDELLGSQEDPETSALSAIEEEQRNYRDEIGLEQLLHSQPKNRKQILALAAVYEIAVPIEAIVAVCPPGTTQALVEKSVDVGLLQSGIHPGNGEQRYLVSDLLRPLLTAMAEAPSADDWLLVRRVALDFLHELWVARGQEAELQEVRRLAKECGNLKIEGDLDAQLAGRQMFGVAEQSAEVATVVEVEAARHSPVPRAPADLWLVLKGEPLGPVIRWNRLSLETPKNGEIRHLTATSGALIAAQDGQQLRVASVNRVTGRTAEWHTTIGLAPLGPGTVLAIDTAGSVDVAFVWAGENGTDIYRGRRSDSSLEHVRKLAAEHASAAVLHGVRALFAVPNSRSNLGECPAFPELAVTSMVAACANGVLLVLACGVSQGGQQSSWVERSGRVRQQVSPGSAIELHLSSREPPSLVAASGTPVDWSSDVLAVTAYEHWSSPIISRPAGKE